MTKETKKLSGAAAISHAKKVAEVRRHKASIASIKSVQKRKANMTAEELAAWKQKQSKASAESHKRRLAAMTAEQLAEFKAKRNAYAKARREAKKAVAAAAAEIENQNNNSVEAAE